MDKGLTTGRQAASNEMEDEGKRASSGSWALMHLICGIGSDRDWAKNRTMDGGIHPQNESAFRIETALSYVARQNNMLICTIMRGCVD